MIANFITAIRIVCSIALLFFPVFSPAFYTLYIVAGISDILDGTVARKTGTSDILGKTTELGFLYRGKYKNCINNNCQMRFV